MAGNLKTNSIQLGDSATASQNFVLQTNVDGTAKLARGNVGGTTQDILTVDATGGVKMPQNVVAFNAHASVATSIPNNTHVKIFFQIKDFDTTSAYDAITNSRFQPLVTGYYQINAFVASTVGSSTGIMQVELNKNGSIISQGNVLVNNTQSLGVGLNQLIYLNGTTDYLEINVWQNGGVTMSTVASPITYFQGILIARA